MSSTSLGRTLHTYTCMPRHTRTTPPLAHTSSPKWLKIKVISISRRVLAVWFVFPLAVPPWTLALEWSALAVDLCCSKVMGRFAIEWIWAWSPLFSICESLPTLAGQVISGEQLFYSLPFKVFYGFVRPAQWLSLVSCCLHLWKTWFPAHVQSRFWRQSSKADGPLFGNRSICGSTRRMN